MGFRKDGVSLDNYIFGFGTNFTPSGFSTVPFDSGFTIRGASTRMVPRNSIFMPFSDELNVIGYKRDGSNILSVSSFAGKNRFILSNVAKETKTGNSNDLIPIYYKGGGTYNSLGYLYVGGTSTSNIIHNQNTPTCPPVIMIAVQAAGGNGGSGVWKWAPLAYAWVSAGGAGGGSGAFGAFYIKLPYDAVTPTLVGYYRLNGSVELFRPDNVVSPFFTVGKGGNGASSYITDGLVVSQGMIGLAGPYSYSTSLTPPNFLSAIKLNSSGSLTSQAIQGAPGRPGAHWYAELHTFGGLGYTMTGTVLGNGRGLDDKIIYLNSGTVDNTIVGKSGGTLTGDYGGGNGAGSMFAVGKTSNTSASLSDYGVGGGGGWAGEEFGEFYLGGTVTKTGGSGGRGCVRFYW